MSEEVTYADLHFQDTSKTENIYEHDSLEKKDPSAPSSVWRPMTLALILLCLLLLIGLGILGIIFHRNSKIEMRKLQNLKEEFQKNISLQETNNKNFLQIIATEFCREIVKTNNGIKEI
ncbi:C-type lectin domain family 12 member A-like [Rhynchocyon petersi]